MNRFSRRLRSTGLFAGLALLFAGAAAACWFLAYWFDLALPLLGQSASPAPTPIVWTALPQPVVTHTQWTSYTFANTIRGLAVRDRLLWAATDGGAVVFDLGAPNVPPVKFTAEHGLAANRLTSVAASPDGSVWFGSADSGLSRFDGQTWRTYTSANGLPSDEIRDLSFGPDGTLWAATPAGLARFRNGRWRAYTITTTLFAMESNDIRAVAATAGGVWAATNKGVTYFDGRRWQTYTYQQGLANDDTYDLALAADGSLWVATRVGLSHFDGVNWQRFSTADGLLAEQVQSVAVAPDGTVWLAYGTEANGLSRFDGLNWTSFDLLDGLANDTVLSLGLGPAGELFAGTADGVSEYDGRAWALLEAPSEIPSNDLRGLLAARGAVWAGTDHGVSRYDGARWRAYTSLDGLAADSVSALALGPDETPWAAFETPSIGLSRLTGADTWETIACRTAPASPNVSSGALAPDGSVWFATDHGVSRFDGEAWATYTPTDGLPAEAVTALAVAPSGEVWAATLNGVALFEGGRWNTVAPEAARLLAIDPAGTVWVVTPDGLNRWANGRFEPVEGAPAASIRALAATAEGVWLATAEGLAVWSAGTWRTYTTADGLNSDDVTALTAEPNGTLWAGYADAALGFNFFDGERWRSYPEELVDDTVTSIHVQDDGTVWVGTMGGISRYNGAEWQSFTTADGLPSNFVLSVATAYGSVWVATPEGVGRYDGQTWQAYDTGSGLVSNQARELAVGPDGQLWVGFDRMRWGLSVFDGQQWQTHAEWNRDAVLYSLTFAADGRLWASGRFDSPVVGQSNGFLAAFDGDVWDWRPVLADWPFGARDLQAAPDNRLWAAVDGNRGLQVLDVQGEGLGREVAYYSEAIYADPLAIASDGTVWVSNNFRTKLLAFDGSEWHYQSIPLSALLSAIAPAPDGSLWVGTNRGAARFAEGAWQTFRAPASVYGRPKGAAGVMAVTDDGALWFGTSAGGATRYRADHARLNTYPAALSRHPATAILQTPDGAVWVSTDGGGVGRYDGNAWEVFAPDSLLDTALVRAFTLAADGSAWLGTPSGAVRLSGSNCAFDPRWRNRSNVLAIEAAPEGVWVGTRSAGAMLGGLTDESVVETREQTGSLITALDAAPDGSVWFAAEEAVWGLVGGQWQKIAVDSDLAAGGLNAVLSAPDHTLWIGTAQGAAFRDGRRWQVFTPADGLADREVQSILAAPDGSLWFATPGGLSRYQP